MNVNLRFLVGLSFSGEQRPYVERMARSLARRLPGEIESVLYDRFHAAEFAVPRLAYYLPKLYKYNTVLIVVVMSGEYTQKDWCGLEWDAIFSLVKSQQTHRVMLFHADGGVLPGLHGLESSISINDISPEAAAELVLERLAINQGLSRNHYLICDPVKIYETGLERPPNCRRLIFIIFAILVTIALFGIFILTIHLF